MNFKSNDKVFAQFLQIFKRELRNIIGSMFFYLKRVLTCKKYKVKKFSAVKGMMQNRIKCKDRESFSLEHFIYV